MSRRRLGALGLLGLGLLGASLSPPARPLLVWNATASVPLGLYRIGPPDPLQPGDLVLVSPPPAQAAWLAERGVLPPGVPLLKPIAATGGSRVCREGLAIRIDGPWRAQALATDHQGRALPGWSGCRVLGAGEVFLLNPAVPASLDGRYFGPTGRGSILGKAVPLWTR